MMRNCFKRADKQPASTNIVESTSTQPALQQQSQQPTATSPTVKKSTGSLKTKNNSNNANNQNINPSASYNITQSTYILPATTQSRTLQNSNHHINQQKNGMNVKTHHNIGSAGSKSVVKSASVNYLGHSQTQHVDGSGMVVGPPPYTHTQQKPGSSPGAQTGYGLRPESGKKHLNQGSQRTSFLLHTQGGSTNGGAGVNQGASVGSSSTNGYLSHLTKHKNQSLTHLQQQQPGENNPVVHHQGPQGGSFLSRSPPQRVMQSRKISGKSMKSNRVAHHPHQQFNTGISSGGNTNTNAAMSKKSQQVSQVTGSVSSSQIFPSSNVTTHANNSQMHQQEKGGQASNAVAGNISRSNQSPHHLHTNNSNNQQPQQQHVEEQHAGRVGQVRKETKTPSEALTQNISHHHLHANKKQGSLVVSGNGNFFDAVQATTNTTSNPSHANQTQQQLQMTKQLSSSQSNKQGGLGATNAMNPTAGSNSRKNGGQTAGKGNGADLNVGGSNGSSAPGTLGLKVYQSVGKPSPLTTSASLKIMKANTQNLVETGAVAAVIPQSTSHNTKQTMDKLGGSSSVTPSETKATTSKRVNSQGASNGVTRQLAASQKFLPTISQAPSHSINSSQSPYHTEPELQPQQQIVTSQQHQQAQQPINSESDYFIQKPQGQPHTLSRSTSQPPSQSHPMSNGVGPGGCQPSQQTNASSYTTSGQQYNTMAPLASQNSGNNVSASMQMQNLLNKGLRSVSEPAQPPPHQLKKSDSAASFMENLKQRAAFTVVMKAAMLPKLPKSNIPRTGTEAQMASESIKAHVAKLLQKNQPHSTLPFFQTSKISSKAFGMVKAFAANTNVGIVRKANEDRISIILNVIQPPQKEPRIPTELWPKLQIFGVYDGHGGSRCAEYLKDTLHNNIILQDEFPSNIHEAIRKGCFKTEEEFLKLVCPAPNQPYNKAGSCAIVIMIVNDDVYVINVGDSRALSSISEHPSDSMIQTKASQALNLSAEASSSENPTQFNMEATSTVKVLSRDHKPSDPIEFNRITEAGGYIYQTQTVMKNGYPTTGTQQVKQETIPPPDDSDDEENPFVGPYRVFPGRLSVCRTFGDCEAKLAHLGGLQGVVTCEPETTLEQGGVNYLDYVLIGSDGIFDKLKNDQINQIVWDVTTRQRFLSHSQGQPPSIHTISGLVCDEILHAAARNRSLDNISVVFVAFQRFKDYVEMMFKQEMFVASVPQQPVPSINLHQITAQEAESSTDAARSCRIANLNSHHNLQQQLVQQTSSSSKTPQRILNSQGGPKMKSSKQSDEVAKENAFPAKSHMNKGNLAFGNNSAYRLSEQSAPLQAYSSATHNQMSTIGTSKSQSLSNLQTAPMELNQQNSNQQHSHRPTSGSTRIKGQIRSRKGNSTVNNGTGAGSHSQDNRSSLPQVQPGGAPITNNLTGKQHSTSRDQQVAQSSASTTNPNSCQQLLQEAKNVATGGPAGSNTTGHQYQSLEQMSQAHQQNTNRRGGLFKVNTHHVPQTSSGSNNIPHQSHPISKGVGAPNSQSQQIQQDHPHLSNMMVKQSSHRSSGGANGGGNLAASNSSSQVRKSSASLKQMKPYKSNQTRRMPENPSSSAVAGQGGTSSSQQSRDPSTGSNNNNYHSHNHHRFNEQDGSHRFSRDIAQHQQMQQKGTQ